MSKGLHGNECAYNLPSCMIDAMSSPLFGVTVQVLSQFSGIHAQSTFFAIHKMGGCAAVGDGVGRSHEREGWHKNLVTRGYAGQFEGDMQSGGSVDDRH